jgi:hypothetical protein
MLPRPIALVFLALLALVAGDFPAALVAAEPVTPRETTPLFNGKDLTGLTTWLKDTQRDDPRRVFRVTDGMLHLSGEGNGYVATDKEYRNYRLTVEYKWGEKTYGAKYVRNSGILLHATGPDGGAGGSWPSSIECQLAQGCAGDIIVIRGKDAAGQPIPVDVTAETEASPKGNRRRWKAGGQSLTFPPTRGQLWWNKHDWDFAELIDTRGKDDIESPLGEWTRVEVVADGEKLAISINGQKVNECTRVQPAAGKILLQTEGFEIFFRKFELHPLEAKAQGS